MFVNNNIKIIPLSKFDSKKSTHFYVAVVTNVDLHEIECSFLRKVDEVGLLFKFPDAPDNSWIPFEDIVEILAAPTLVRGLYKFPSPISCVQ